MLVETNTRLLSKPEDQLLFTLIGTPGKSLNCLCHSAGQHIPSLQGL